MKENLEQPKKPRLTAEERQRKQKLMDDAWREIQEGRAGKVTAPESPKQAPREGPPPISREKHDEILIRELEPIAAQGTTEKAARYATEDEKSAAEVERITPQIRKIFQEEDARMKQSADGAQEKAAEADLKKEEAETHEARARTLDIGVKLEEKPEAEVEAGIEPAWRPSGESLIRGKNAWGAVLEAEGRPDTEEEARIMEQRNNVAKSVADGERHTAKMRARTREERNRAAQHDLGGRPDFLDVLGSETPPEGDSRGEVSPRTDTASRFTQVLDEKNLLPESGLHKMLAKQLERVTESRFGRWMQKNVPQVKYFLGMGSFEYAWTADVLKGDTRDFEKNIQNVLKWPGRASENHKQRVLNDAEDAFVKMKKLLEEGRAAEQTKGVSVDSRRIGRVEWALGVLEKGQNDLKKIREEMHF